MHLKADLVGDTNQGRVGVRGEIEVGQQRSGVVGPSLVGPVDRGKVPARRPGLGDDVERRDALGFRVGLIDDDRPCAVRLPVGGQAGWPMDRTHLGLGIGGHRGGVEGGVLDVVAHALHIVRAHRLNIEQSAAVIEMELTVPAVMNGIAEVHELRRGADIELQALEDGDDVITGIAQCPLHAPGVDRAGTGPLLDRDLKHPRAAERLDTPSHSGTVDQLAYQQEFRHQDGQLSAGQCGIAALRLAHPSKPSPDSEGVLQCRAWLMRTRSRRSNG